VTDRIILRTMRFRGRHGVHRWEQETEQPFDVDVELALDLRPAALADDLALSVDYASVYSTCRTIVERRSYRLLEALAEAIARELLASRRIEEVLVRVRKPEVDLGGPVGSAGVEIVRRRA
jgi:dihydroneopterin aldolase